MFVCTIQSCLVLPGCLSNHQKENNQDVWAIRHNEYGRGLVNISIPKTWLILLHFIHYFCVFWMYFPSFLPAGVPTIHDKGLVDFNGSFSYGALVNNDGVASATPPVTLKDPPVRSRSSDSSAGAPNLKRDWNSIWRYAQKVYWAFFASVVDHSPALLGHLWLLRGSLSLPYIPAT